MSRWVYRALLGLLLWGVARPLWAETPTTDQAITDKQQEITELDKKIAELKRQQSSTTTEAERINNTLAQVQGQLRKAQLELSQTQSTIVVAEKEADRVQTSVETTQQQIAARRAQLASVIRQLYQSEQGSWVKIVLGGQTLSTLLTEQTTYVALQRQTIQLVTELHTTETKLIDRQKQLVARQQNLQSLQHVLANQNEELAHQQTSQQTFLRQKRQEQAHYQAQLAAAERTRQEIAQAIFTLHSTGVKVKLTDANEMARFAAKATGVRAALIMAVLKLESDVGTQIGNGHYPDDMHPASREAFVRLMKQLGLDPLTSPVSARPRSYQGWGGAMGPGQFLPDTWERLQPQLEKILGHPGNPYQLSDAFVATGILLASDGATDRGREVEAVSRYMAGPYWQRFTWYGDRALAVAEEYAKQGL